MSNAVNERAESLRLVEQKMFSRVAESPYVLILNGTVIKYKGKPVQVAMRNKRVRFFIKEASQEQIVEDSRKDEIMTSFVDNSYGDHNFTSYMLEKQKNATIYNEEMTRDLMYLVPAVTFDNTLRLIIVETLIYSLLKAHEERPIGTSLILRDSTGNFLDARQLEALRNHFITNCFLANIEVTRLIFLGRIGRVMDYKRNKYSNQTDGNLFSGNGEFFIGLVKHKNLHNPWLDNTRLRESVKGYPMFQLLFRRLRYDPRSQHLSNVISNLSFAYITHCEASAHLGLSRKFPFSYTIFQNLLVGLVMLPAEHNFKFPAINSYVFVYTGDSSEEYLYSEYLTPKEYMDLSENDRELYTQTNTTVLLINSNEAFFKTKGISETRTRFTKNFRLYEMLLELNLRAEDVWTEAQ